VTFTARFWGTRGSVPSPGPSTVRYGGNTPCVELRTGDGALLILDAGTGIRALGNALVANAGDAPVVADIVLSHLHWDHIQGLPFFAPLFRAGDRLTVRAAAGMVADAERVLHEQMAAKVFPVGFGETAAKIEFRGINGAAVGPGYELRAHPVRHPGGALGVRVTAAGSSPRALVYVPDNELDPAAPYDAAPGWRDALVDFVRGAHVLVHDSMYTPGEYARHRGWGHSTFADAVALALDAEVETLVLFHHEPDRSDAGVDAVVRECQAIVARSGRPLTVIAASEGLRVVV
jgi:phosphoribosyl 1,2-cyclic phosphodiesterase